ncbi:TPA: RHS repeat-associated core domain-containing protein, partial [Escherichia coli]
LWDGMRLAQESRPEGTGSLYIYRDQGSYEPLARVDKAGKEGPNRILYFHTDVNGAPEEMTDSDGKIVWETGYQVWGNTIQEKDHGGVEQNLRYQGQYLDRETGLHYNLHRYYDPDVGRFMVTDPIGLLGGLNLYAYAPNPLGWVDPLGLKIVTVYHYTDQGGYNGISSQKPYKFKASSPIKGHPKGIYVTTKSPEELAKTPNGFKKLGLTSTKSTHFFEFQIDDSLLKPIRGDRGEFIRYIEGDLDLDRNNVSRHGKTPKCGGK